jgi:hypothetical protein
MSPTRICAGACLAVLLAVGRSAVPISAGPNSAEVESKIAAAGRPRLMLSADSLSKLRRDITGAKLEAWERLRAAVDRSLGDNPPENRPIEGDPTRPGTPNDEMLWQRVFGYRIPGLALVALLNPESKYLDAVRRWAMKPGEYPLWGAGIFEGTDLAAAHELYGISFAYDWLYDRWTPEERAQIKQILADHGRVMYEAAIGLNDRGWWKETWRQNHAWCNYGALGVTAVALAGDVPGVGEWLARSEWAYQRIFAELPAEGAYEEGVPYWGYGMESAIRFITAVRPFVATDFFASPYLRKTHLFRLYMAGPKVGTCANFGDGPPRDWHAIGPLMRRLAAEYRDPAAQWLAEALPGRQDLDAAAYELLWTDPSLQGRSPDNLPLWHLFRQTGFAAARTSWKEDALTLHVRSGRADVSHSHLDLNNFLLNAGGEWLLHDYGYGKVGPGYFNRKVDYFSNDTAGHNCLVVGGRNQRKDADSLGILTDGSEANGVVWFRSDATRAYEGAQSVVREWALVRPHTGTGKWGCLVVRDRARFQSAQRFDFMLQPGAPVEYAANRAAAGLLEPTPESETDRFLIQGEKSSLFGVVLSPRKVTMRVLSGLGTVNVEKPMALKISAASTAREIEFIVVLVPLAQGERAPQIEALPGKSGAKVGGESVVFDADGRRPARLDISGP